MSEWKTLQLSAIGNIRLSNVDKKVDNKESKVLLCNYMDVYKNRYLSKNHQFSIGSVSKQELIRYSLVENDVIITKDSETPDDIGIPAVIIDTIPTLVCSYHLAIIRSDQSKYDGKFLMNVLQTEKVRKWFTSKCNGITRYGLTLDVIKNAPVRLPIDIMEQSKIAEILTTIDDAIEKTEKIIAKYKRIKQGLMQDLLTKGIDENGNIRSEATHKFKDSPLGRIPVEWEIVSIDNIVEHVGSGSTPRGGQSVYLKEGILFIRSQNVSFDGLLLKEVAYIDYKTHKRMKRSIVKDGDVLLNITGASLGRVCIYKERKEANVNQHVCIIRVKDSKEYNPEFLNAYLASYYGQWQIEKLIAGGNREGLNFSHIRTIKVPYLKYDEQKRIVNILKTVNLTINNYIKDLHKQIAIKQGLMNDLLTGKVKVTHLLDKGGESGECNT